MKKHSGLLLISIFILAMAGCASQPVCTYSVSRAKENLDFALDQYAGMHASYTDRATYPNCILENGKTRYVAPRDWTSGFYPASLWYLYEYSGDAKFKAMAEESNAGLEEIKSYTGTHDLGFMLNDSFGNGLRLGGPAEYRDILIEGARTLADRFNPKVGCTLSWNWGARQGWQFPVIIDNMMNLEYLFWAAKETGEAAFKDIAVTHAKTTQKHHFRGDDSSYHVVDYDKDTGQVRWRGTFQGCADTSAWARGQAWGLYGYTMTYRETKDPMFLAQAEGIAQFILNHPNLPEDGIPYWDFNAPDIPEAPRDTSAAAIMASALLELSTFADAPNKTQYRVAAEKLLRSLSSPAYRAELGENNYFILKHSVGHFPNNSQIDTPINYTDYYFIEALMRYLALAGR